ncbi:hypothetical protein H4R33_005662 [Dimargaris cristalligena]|nr:hypothetical protein H4R33_005662 [Dimargaris cristalligena]
MLQNHYPQRWAIGIYLGILCTLPYHPIWADNCISHHTRCFTFDLQPGKVHQAQATFPYWWGTPASSPKPKQNPAKLSTPPVYWNAPPPLPKPAVPTKSRYERIPKEKFEMFFLPAEVLDIFVGDFASLGANDIIKARHVFWKYVLSGTLTETESRGVILALDMLPLRHMYQVVYQYMFARTPFNPNTDDASLAGKPCVHRIKRNVPFTLLQQGQPELAVAVLKKVHQWSLTVTDSRPNSRSASPEPGVLPSLWSVKSSLLSPDMSYRTWASSIWTVLVRNCLNTAAVLNDGDGIYLLLQLLRSLGEEHRFSGEPLLATYLAAFWFTNDEAMDELSRALECGQVNPDHTDLCYQLKAGSFGGLVPRARQQILARGGPVLGQAIWSTRPFSISPQTSKGKVLAALERPQHPQFIAFK